MKKYLSLLMCTIFLNGTEVPLSEIPYSNPVEVFEADTSSDNLRMFGIYGFALFIPEVEMIHFDVCFRSNARLEPISGTSDVISTHSQKNFQSIAVDFASKYNLLMIKYLQQNNLCNCDTDEDWGLAYTQLRDLIWGPLQNQGTVGYQLDYSLITFVISISDKARVEELLEEISRIFINNSITRRVKFSFTEYYKESNGWIKNPLKCYVYENGTINLITDI